MRVLTLEEIEAIQHPRTAERKAINAAFPTRSGRHDLYAEAMRLVGERHTKSDLVALVTWLLLRVEEAAGTRDHTADRKRAAAAIETLMDENDDLFRALSDGPKEPA